MDKDELLLRINDRLYLAKNDPDFLKKYVRYFPEDSDALFRYAQELDGQGQAKQALRYYTLAAEKGSMDAERHLNPASTMNRNGIGSPSSFANQQPNPTDKRLKRMLVVAVAVLILALLLLFLKSCDPDAGYSAPLSQADSSHGSATGSGTPAPLESITPPSMSDSNKRVAIQDAFTADELQYLVALNALVRFEEERGSYPARLDDLMQDNPENWISGLSKRLSYKTDGSSFSLELKEVTDQLGIDTDDSRSYRRYLWELHFYPETNQLALVSGQTPLAVFSVASGTGPLPFSDNRVRERVVAPNGKDSALGSRGLALSDNYAIHGTNDPNSIGRYVTDGCIRLLNEDIEKLYPYVAKGTPFRVMEKVTPGQPMFELGLPPLFVPGEDLNKETTPHQEYRWKN